MAISAKRNALIAALVALMLLVYWDIYLAMLLPWFSLSPNARHHHDFADVQPRYRAYQEISEIVLAPAHKFDRWLRPSRWNLRMPFEHRTDEQSPI